MVIGEAPGAEEDIQGEPFVGRAGQLLDQMLLAIGCPRSSVYIANIVKCRPPNNRNPQTEEALHCAPFLHRQISLIQPEVILALGKVAAQSLLHSDLPIGKMRGSQHRYATMDTPVVVTYHPAYLLRSPKEKAKSWQDLKLVRSFLE
jgi:DNA polymerase